MTARRPSLRLSSPPRERTRITRDGAARRAGLQHRPEQPARRRFLVGSGMAALTGALAACGGGGGGTSGSSGTETTATSHAYSVVIDTTQVKDGLNSDLLGHNIQWTGLGEGLLDSAGTPNATLNDTVKSLHPPFLRFPGGEHADVYHWADAVGPQASRTDNQNSGTLQYESSVMGTAEFLDLCLRTGAQPVITVNVPSGTAAEAAAWVKAVNVTRMTSPTTGATLPTVTYWEIGNEPYLDSDTLPNLAMDAAAFATKASAIITAMRAEDPSILVGIPLSTDSRNGTLVVREASWTFSVLNNMKVSVDYAAVHNGYLPLAYDKLTDQTAVYWAAMAAARSVTADMDALQTVISENWGGQKLPLALTEYAALFSTDTGGASDTWTGSPAGALYVADLLRTLASRNDVMFANLWSLSENDRFGAIHANGWLRPVGQVMKMMRPVLTGSGLASTVTCNTVSTVSAGFVEATTGLPLVEGLSSITTGTTTQTIRVLLLQRDPKTAGQGTVDLAGWSNAANVKATVSRLYTSTPFASDDVQGLFTADTVDVSTAISSTALRCSVTLPTCCLAVLEVTRTL